MTRATSRGVTARAALWSALVACAQAQGEPAGATTPAAPDPVVAPATTTTAATAVAIPSPEELEARGAVIGRIIVVPDDVFDPSIPGEDGWLYRTANKLHINTRPAVIRDQLLFRTGDRYDARLIEENERILRRNDYLYDAEIRAVAFDGHTVDLEVRTKDVWTLNPGFNFGRSGGKNATSVHVQEENLLGTGRKVEVAWGSDVDATAWTFSFIDPHFIEAFTRLGVSYTAADDGDSKTFTLGRSFVSLDSRHAWGTNLADTRFVNDRYEYGKKVGEFRQHSQYYEASGGWSDGLVDGWVTRWTAGATWREDQFELEPGKSPAGPLPPDRTWAYPWIGVERVEDAWQERRNQDQILRIEDVLVGFRGWARLGYAPSGLGSTTDAVMLAAGAQDGTDLGPGRSLFGSAWASGRVVRGHLENGILGAEARYYWATSSRSKFYAFASGTTTHDLDEDTQLTLGGDTGLRGYPLRYQAGTSKVLFTVEQRYYTDWYPFRLFRVGGAVFADAGRTWGRDVTGATSDGWLGDVGFGLRLGSSRSAFGNVVHVDLAFPLDRPTDIDSVQFIIETSERF
ncbi:MAG: BamA/TamA family outer membrane protein [Steroidobacteraceae bacterium]